MQLRRSLRVASAVVTVDPPGCLSKDAAAASPAGLPSSSSSAATVELAILARYARPPAPEARDDQVRPRPCRIRAVQVGSNGLQTI